MNVRERYLADMLSHMSVMVNDEKYHECFRYSVKMIDAFASMKFVDGVFITKILADVFFDIGVIVKEDKVDKESLDKVRSTIKEYIVAIRQKRSGGDDVCGVLKQMTYFTVLCDQLTQN